jgi:Glutathione S-transferase, N-terminal domain
VIAGLPRILLLTPLHRYDPKLRMMHLREHATGIKLYYHPLSTYSRRVLMAFAERQIPHDLVVVDMAARKHREQPYLALNPYGRVPTLEEDGFVLFESTAILNYLEATRPAPPLVPADARGRALVDMHTPKVSDRRGGLRTPEFVGAKWGSERHPLLHRKTLLALSLCVASSPCGVCNVDRCVFLAAKLWARLQGSSGPVRKGGSAQNA